MADFFSCPFCEAVVPDGSLSCHICGEDIRIAILVCLMPSPEIPAGTSWILGPHNYNVGRDSSSDIVIPDPHASKTHFRIIYSEGQFKIKPVGRNFPDNGGKVDLKNIHAGNARLSLSYIRDVDFSRYKQNSARAFKIAFSAAVAINEMNDLAQIAITATDAVLKISGMEKGYFFKIIHGDDEDCTFEFLAARSSVMGDLDSRFCPVSTQFCNKLFESKEAIVLIKPEKLPTAMLSSSIKRLNLQMILGLKFPDSEGRPGSMIYADTSHSQTAEIFDYYRPALAIFAKMLARKISCKQDLR
jgi:hypothetical protein